MIFEVIAVTALDCIFIPAFFCFTDLKRLYFQAGVENKPTVFLFADTQVVDEIFLEDINNILSSGEVPNLYKVNCKHQTNADSESICY